MTIRSDFCCLFDFPIEHSTQIKCNITKYIIDILGNKEETYNIFKNFFQVVDSPNEIIQFCLFEETITFSYVLDVIDNFLNFLDTIKDELKINYEAKELCTEYIEVGSEDYQRSSNDDIRELYVSCQLGGVPEVNDITLLEWINNIN